ncbi:hypothetical protein DYB37_002770 [Aphanomyces astaci]|uniref:C2 domain-containing protein n=1 Tax=Aphanomyces astaci TaxID=112090 RepID=A0A3R6XJF9_APHAT|nr:hypothetical protein DYB35_002003 [Aphanomyces astaci]RHZ23545.1 hypothetical protein DYB37_002770 [Aphanomyces astaci]
MTAAAYYQRTEPAVKRDQKVHSHIPRILRVQVQCAKQVQLRGCLLPMRGLSVETKLRGVGSKHPSKSTPRRAPKSSEVMWEHQVYSFEVTEAEMYSRVLEFAIHEENCLGQTSQLGSATLPLSEFESHRFAGVCSRRLKLERARFALELYVAVEVWNRHDVAHAVTRDCWEHERFVPLKGWSTEHLRAADNRPAYRAGWKCRRRMLSQVCRRAELDTSIEVDTKGEDMKKTVALVDLSIEAILQKHDVQLEDY